MTRNVLQVNQAVSRPMNPERHDLTGGSKFHVTNIGIIPEAHVVDASMVLHDHGLDLLQMRCRHIAPDRASI